LREGNSENRQHLARASHNEYLQDLVIRRSFNQLVEVAFGVKAIGIVEES